MTINCAERGLLLLRVRDEIRMTIAAYQTLCVPSAHAPAVCARPARPSYARALALVHAIALAFLPVSSRSSLGWRVG